MSTERILVQSSILPAFRDALQKTISTIFPASNPGITVMAAAVEKNKRLIADAVSKGAKIVHGDPSIEESTKTRMAPIVVEGVQKDMDLYYPERFGPSVSLIPFEKEE
jgi:acyl-CoA reductase-like NAD-dependent aldehyde dehydrogenase